MGKIRKSATVVKLFREAGKMWLKRRFKRVPATIAIVSTLFFILSIIGVITITDHIWRNVSLGVLIVAGSISFYEFFLELPSAVYERDTEALQKEVNKRSFAYGIQISQEGNLSQFMAIKPDIVYVTGSKTDRKIYSLHTEINCLYLKPIIIKTISGHFRVPLDSETIGRHEAVIDFRKKTNNISFGGLSNGIKGITRDVILLCEDNPIVPRTFDTDKVIYIEGSATISTDILPEIQLSFQGAIRLEQLRGLESHEL